MPLPSSTIGYYDFGNVYRGATTQYQAGADIAQQMSALGKRIAESISTQNAQREARELTPIIGAEYQSGLQKIMAGDVGGGLGQIYSTSAMASQNPLLARMAQDASTAAGYIANNQLKQGLLNQEYRMRESLTNQRFEGQRLLQEDRQAHDLQMLQGRQQQPMNPDKIQSHYRNYWSNRDKTMASLEDAISLGDAAQVDELRGRLAQEDATLIANGLKVERQDGTSLLSESEYKKFIELQNQFSTLDLKSEEGKKLAKEYNNFISNIKSRGEELIQEKLKMFNHRNVPIEGELPDLGTPNEDIAPIAGDEEQVLTPDAVLERVRQGTMTKEEARRIAEQQGWQ